MNIETRFELGAHVWYVNNLLAFCQAAFPWQDAHMGSQASLGCGIVSGFKILTSPRGPASFYTLRVRREGKVEDVDYAEHHVFASFDDLVVSAKLAAVEYAKPIR